MTDVGAFSAALGLNEATVRRTLESEGSAAADAAPWYVQLLLGIGAWITALIMIAFVAVLLGLMLDVDEPNLGSAVIGAGMFLCGLLIQARPRVGVFAEQFSIALVVAGAVIASVSVGFEFDEVWSAAVTAIAIAAIDLWRGKSSQQQFLLAAFAVGLVVAALSDMDIGHQIDIFALAAPIGAWLYLRPLAKIDIRPTATALLLALPFYAVASDSAFAMADGSGAWGARAIATATALALAWLHSRQSANSLSHLGLAVAAAAAIAIGLLLPPGGSAALVILMLAFTLGHWPLAIVGVLLEVYFVPRFYYDLEMTLLTKSWILMAAGVVLLASYGALRRAGAETR